MFNMHHEYSAKLTTCEDIKEYCMGGRAVVTLLSPATKVHHTYYFLKPRNEDVFPDDVRFVYAVHAEQKLFYLGMIEQDKFRLTRASRFDNHTDIVKGARYIMRMMADSRTLDRMELYHEGICSVCGRALTNPKSLKSGIGPKCRKRISCQ